MIAMMSFDTALLLLPGLVIGLTVHECAHAWSASLLGDDFPRRMGRVSLNPLRHLSPLGTLAIFLLPIGWGKPVMVNLFNFRRPKLDYLLTSLAGPLANLLLAGLLILPMLLTRHVFWFGRASVNAMETAHELLTYAALLNLGLAVLNLLPIPPLDGSKIWPCLIPGARPGMSKRLTWVFIVVILVLASSRSFGVVIGPVVQFAYNVLPVSDSLRADSLILAADDALRDKQYARAESLSGEMLAIDDRSAEAFYYRALARGWQENWQDALEDLNSAISYSPADYRSSRYYDFRADVLAHLGRTEAAGRDRMRALELDPSLATMAPASQPATQPGDLPGE